MASNPVSKTISDIVGKLPDWVRRDLSSDVANTRQQAEETVAAMIAAAIAAVDHDGDAKE